MANKNALNKDPFTYAEDRRRFLQDLQRFHTSRGTPFDRIPQIGGREIDLYRLYRNVTDLGGWQKVNNDLLWEDIQEEFNVPLACTNGAQALKYIYFRYLNIYEKVHFLGLDPDSCVDDQEEGPARKKVCLPVESIPLSYNYNQHKLQDNQRAAQHLSTDLARFSDYGKLEMSLRSGMANEVDFAVNVCLLLSNEGRHVLKLNKSLHLLPLLMANIGIFEEGPSTMEDVMFSCWKSGESKRDFLRFWHDVVEDGEIREQIKTKNGVYKRDDLIGKEVLHLGRELGVRDAEGQRVLQLATLVRNLSFEEVNQQLLASSVLVFRFLMLCVHSSYGSLRQLALDTLGNLAAQMVLQTTTTQLVLNLIKKSLLDQDKFVIVRALEMLGKLCQLEKNEAILSECLEGEMYARVIQLLTVHDIQLIVHTLEALYQLSELGVTTTNMIANVKQAVDLLVNLITVEAQSYGPNSLIGIKVVEYVPPTDPKAAFASATAQPSRTVIQSVAPGQALGFPVPTSSFPASADQARADVETTASNWIQGTFETKKGSSITQADLFADYQQFCRKFGIADTLSATDLAAIVRSAVPQAKLAEVDRGEGEKETVIKGLGKRAKPKPFAILTGSDKVAKPSACNVPVNSPRTSGPASWPFHPNPMVTPPPSLPPPAAPTHTPTLRQRLMEPPRMSLQQQFLHHAGATSAGAPPSPRSASTGAKGQQSTAGKLSPGALKKRQTAPASLPAGQPSAPASPRGEALVPLAPRPALMANIHQRPLAAVTTLQQQLQVAGAPQPASSLLVAAGGEQVVLQSTTSQMPKPGTTAVSVPSLTCTSLSTPLTVSTPAMVMTSMTPSSSSMSTPSASPGQQFPLIHQALQGDGAGVGMGVGGKGVIGEQGSDTVLIKSLLAKKVCQNMVRQGNTTPCHSPPPSDALLDSPTTESSQPLSQQQSVEVPADHQHAQTQSVLHHPIQHQPHQHQEHSQEAQQPVQQQQQLLQHVQPQPVRQQQQLQCQTQGVQVSQPQLLQQHQNSQAHLMHQQQNTQAQVVQLQQPGLQTSLVQQQQQQVGHPQSVQQQVPHIQLVQQQQVSQSQLVHQQQQQVSPSQLVHQQQQVSQSQLVHQQQQVSQSQLVHQQQQQVSQTQLIQQQLVHQQQISQSPLLHQQQQQVSQSQLVHQQQQGSQTQVVHQQQVAHSQLLQQVSQSQSVQQPQPCPSSQLVQHQQVAQLVQHHQQPQQQQAHQSQLIQQSQSTHQPQQQQVAQLVHHQQHQLQISQSQLVQVSQSQLLQQQVSQAQQKQESSHLQPAQQQQQQQHPQPVIQALVHQQPVGQPQVAAVQQKQQQQQQQHAQPQVLLPQAPSQQPALHSQLQAQLQHTHLQQQSAQPQVLHIQQGQQVVLHQPAAGQQQQHQVHIQPRVAGHPQQIVLQAGHHQQVHLRPQQQQQIIVQQHPQHVVIQGQPALQHLLHQPLHIQGQGQVTLQGQSQVQIQGQGQLRLQAQSQQPVVIQLPMYQLPQISTSQACVSSSSSSSTPLPTTLVQSTASSLPQTTVVPYRTIIPHPTVSVAAAVAGCRGQISVGGTNVAAHGTVVVQEQGDGGVGESVSPDSRMQQDMKSHGSNNSSAVQHVYTPSQAVQTAVYEGRTAAPAHVLVSQSVMPSIPAAVSSGLSASVTPSLSSSFPSSSVAPSVSVSCSAMSGSLSHMSWSATRPTPAVQASSMSITQAILSGQDIHKSGPNHPPVSSSVESHSHPHPQPNPPRHINGSITVATQKQCNGLGEVNGGLGSPESASNDLPPSPMEGVKGGQPHLHNGVCGEEDRWKEGGSSLPQDLLHSMAEKMAKINGVVPHLENGDIKVSICQDKMDVDQDSPTLQVGEQMRSESMQVDVDGSRKLEVWQVNGLSGLKENHVSQPKAGQMLEKQVSVEELSLDSTDSRLVINCSKAGDSTSTRPLFSPDGSHDSDVSCDSFASSLADSVSSDKHSNQGSSHAFPRPSASTAPSPSPSSSSSSTMFPEVPLVLAGTVPISEAATKRSKKKAPPKPKTEKAPAKGKKRKVSGGSNAGPESPSQSAPGASVVTEYMCEWIGCGRCFSSARLVFIHVTKSHVPAVPESVCQWQGCEPLRRKRWSLVTHLQDHHCSEMAQRTASQRRLQAAQAAVASPPPPTTVQQAPALVYPPDAAMQAIKRFHIKPPFTEFADQREGPVTKHIRLTAALILRNLARYSALGRSLIKHRERQLCYVTMSACESSTALSSCLWEILHDT